MRPTQFRDRITNSLRHVNDELGTTLGVLARIDGKSYELVAVDSNSGAFVAGEKFALDDCYCREVCETGRLLTRSDAAPEEPESHHPLYRSLPLECYIGAPIRIGDEIWGCVNFSSMANRTKPFSESDEALVETLARQISTLLPRLSD